MHDIYKRIKSPKGKIHYLTNYADEFHKFSHKYYNAFKQIKILQLQQNKIINYSHSQLKISKYEDYSSDQYFKNSNSGISRLTSGKKRNE